MDENELEKRLMEAINRVELILSATMAAMVEAGPNADELSEGFPMMILESETMNHIQTGFENIEGLIDKFIVNCLLGNFLFHSWAASALRLQADFTELEDMRSERDIAELDKNAPYKSRMEEVVSGSRVSLDSGGLCALVNEYLEMPLLEGWELRLLGLALTADEEVQDAWIANIKAKFGA
jgi:hypothetical protein